MDPATTLDVLRREAGLLAVAARPALGRPVARYPGWTVADVVVHTGRIHRWVTEIVRTLAQDRLAQPDVAPARRPAELMDWFISGAAGLVIALQTPDPSTRVWTFAGDGTVGFWRRRMALETTIHRWDVQAASELPAPVASDVARDGVSEALGIYLLPRLRGTDVGGNGQRVGLRCADGGGEWSVVLLPDEVEIADGAQDADAVVEGSAENLWLFLMGRRALDDLQVSGARAAAELCAAAVARLPTPRR
ncbi:MAG TPA: maleylpyruvate isomerase family mycothiol-dependent enzyme [Euzebyales bacterium]|nr:maleylpyruvate isomerase family mycothiol-dependent enzyme [Euzebyales bacterium]